MNYATAAYAYEYFKRKLYCDLWFEASVEDQEKALSEATLIINTLHYKGCPYLAAQPNAFPRDYQDSELPGEIPLTIKYACCEIAFALIRGDTVEIQMNNYRIKQDIFAKSSTTYTNTDYPLHLLNGVPSMSAWSHLWPYLASTDSINLKRVS